MNQFIIATNNASVSQRNAITDLVKAKGLAFWHHFEDLWMVSSGDSDGITSEQLYNELSDNPVIGKRTYMVIIRIPQHGKPMTYFGYGPKAGWDWTKEYWGRVG